MNRRAATTSIKNQKLDEQISRQINKQQNIFLHSQRNNIYIYIYIYMYTYMYIYIYIFERTKYGICT